jgi:hypothetical protein
MAALLGSQLDCMITCDPLMTSSVIGVFPSDRIQRLHKNQGLIVNTDPHYHEGHHWIAAYNVNNERIEIFDSLNNRKLQNQINFKQLAGDIPIYMNNNALQCADTFACGYYCICFLFFKVRHVTFDTFLSLFSKSCEDNDSIVIEFVKRKYCLCLINHM